MKKKVLLFNPPSALRVYSASSVKAVVPELASMSLAMIAGSLLEEGTNVRIVDLMLYKSQDTERVTQQEIAQFKPDIVGVTATTPLFYEANSISDKAKSISKNIITILGGPHASSLPLDCLKESSFDIIVEGEGERVIKEIVSGNDPKGIKGVYCKGRIGYEKADAIPIDELPFPALELFDTKRYVCSRVIARNNPVGPIEMSRGCPFSCSFCNKTVHGKKFRIKSAGRIIEELSTLKRLGYREFHVLDDQFTADIDKAKEVCEEIIRKNINMSWNLRTGIRVDMVDQEFLGTAKQAGCYQMGVGFESGNQAGLDAVGKGIRLEQAIKAAEMIKRSGIEIAGFFMLGLPGETVEAMEETIRFAIRLNPDYAKATILVPFPGTRIYDEFEKKGLIKTKDWSRYNFHNAHEIYTHPNLSWECLNHYYKLFHRRFYLRLRYLARRFWKSLIQGRLFVDIRCGYQTFLKESPVV
ncbi:MAG: B12-binding domain-containing radical SAM protein [Candidatus Omnitrophica bacterium]|nr:B12-binding domain-containing radical SAM protein [Candidatus Omnitrophota bacterium]